MSVPLPAPDGPEMTNSLGRRAPTPAQRAPSSATSSSRWRSERPPTVFDWLMRHWFRQRVALTRPNFGNDEQDVEDLGGHQILGRPREHLARRHVARLELALQPRPLDPDRVRAAQRLHALVERSKRCLGRDLLAGRHCRLMVGTL